jgi:hypothetical protein
MKKCATGFAAVALSVGVMAAAAAPAAADPPKYSKNHVITATVNFEVHQNKNLDKADRQSGFADFSWPAKGENNGGSPRRIHFQSYAADETFGQEDLYLTEKDTSGTLHVYDYQSLNFLHSSPVHSSLNVDIEPNATRSFWIYTDSAGGDYVHSLVTITNNVY